MPCSKLEHMAISPQVISAPNSLQILRNGKLPTVVSGLKYSLSDHSIFFFSRDLSFTMSSSVTDPKDFLKGLFK